MARRPAAPEVGRSVLDRAPACDRAREASWPPEPGPGRPVRADSARRRSLLLRRYSGEPVPATATTDPPDAWPAAPPAGAPRPRAREKVRLAGTCGRCRASPAG